MKNKIFQEFLNSNLKIKSQEKLKQYILFCMENNYRKKIKYKTSYHHILPKSLFEEYSNLKENPWNGSHLLYSDHYYAHWLLTEAIDNYSMLSAFCAMHNTDIKNGRIIEKDLIPADEFQKKMEERNKEISKLRLDPLWKESVGKKAIAKMVRTRRLKDEDGKDSYEKMVDNKLKLMDKDGLNSFQRGGINSRKVMERKDEDGLTGYQRAGKKLQKTLDKKSKIFDVYDKDDILLYSGILEKEVRKISQNLPFCSKDKPLGNTPAAAQRYINKNKEHLVGLYSIELKRNQNENI